MCVLMYHPITLINGFISYSFLVRSFICRITSLVKKDTFTSSFPVCIYFIPFICLISQAMTAGSTLNRVGRVNKLVWFLVLMEMLHSFYHLV